MPLLTTSRDDHLAEHCRDDYCRRLPCVLYKAGYRNGYQQGYAEGYAAGSAAGFAAGFAAGMASGGGAS
jgi:hypothetical protein